MNLQEQYKRLFKGRVGTTDKKILAESKEIILALDKVAEKGFDAIIKTIDVDHGSVSGMDREGSGTVDLEGQSIDWELETFDGGTTITIGDENLEELDAYDIYGAILQKFNDEGYELDDGEEVNGDLSSSSKYDNHDVVNVYDQLMGQKGFPKRSPKKVKNGLKLLKQYLKDEGLEDLYAKWNLGKGPKLTEEEYIKLINVMRQASWDARG